MATTWRELVRGHPRAPRATLVVGFAAVVAVTLVATVATNALPADDPVGRVLSDVGLPVVLFYAPGLVAAVGAYYRCGAVVCLAGGSLPALLFATTAIVGTVLGAPGVGDGDAPLWSLTLAFATIGVGAAAVGYVAGGAARLAATVVRR